MPDKNLYLQKNLEEILIRPFIDDWTSIINLFLNYNFHWKSIFRHNDNTDFHLLAFWI